MDDNCLHGPSVIVKMCIRDRSQSLDKLAEGRTTLTIAHRLSTIRNADRILVLSGNHIVEEGSHEQLMERQGMYYQLYTSANGING